MNSAQLVPLVEAWLPQQRWFAGKGRAMRVEVEPLGALAPDVEVWLVRTTYQDGSSELYQLPLVARPAAAAGLEHVQLGSIDTTDGVRWIYDALHDKDAAALWLSGVRAAATAGPIRFVRQVDADDIPADLALLKVFRRLQAGTNPDIEIHAALGDRGGRHVARLLGSIDATIGTQQYALGMVQQYLTTATDGWELANASVRDLMAERDLHAEEAGGDFAAEAFRLGAAVAETHHDLAEAFGTSAAEDRGQRLTRMRDRLAGAVTAVPELEPFAAALDACYAAYATSDAPLPQQRIHGDLHLGQALRTVHRWVLIDFEGEPMLELAARREPDSPLRDVAGMLRSFEYAGYHRLMESGTDAQLGYRADEWVTRNRSAFCDGYAAGAGFDPRDNAAALRAFEADKAVYEAIYEARNRPAWLPLALASIQRLVQAEVAR